VGRIIAGLGNGANTATIPTWQSETSMPNERGKLVCIDCCILIFGIVISYWMDYGFAKINGASQWYVPRFLSDRKCFPVAFQALFALLLVLLVLVLPESPRWLIQKGRVDEATRVLQRLIGKEVSAEHERVVRLRETIAGCRGCRFPLSRALERG
jgi:MFS family permease